MRQLSCWCMHGWAGGTSGWHADTMSTCAAPVVQPLPDKQQLQLQPTCTCQDLKVLPGEHRPQTPTKHTCKLVRRKRPSLDKTTLVRGESSCSWPSAWSDILHRNHKHSAPQAAKIYNKTTWVIIGVGVGCAKLQRTVPKGRYGCSSTQAPTHNSSMSHRMICSSRSLLHPSTSRLPSALRAMSCTARGRFHLQADHTYAIWDRRGTVIQG